MSAAAAAAPSPFYLDLLRNHWDLHLQPSAADGGACTYDVCNILGNFDPRTDLLNLGHGTIDLTGRN